MLRRSSWRLGVGAALLTAALAPTAAHAAPTWQPFAAPLFDVPSGTSAGVASVDLDRSGRGALVFGTGDGVTLTEVAGFKAEPTSRTLVAGPAQTARVAVLPGGAETVAAWSDIGGVHVRTRGGGELGAPVDLPGSTGGEFDLAALEDGSVLVAQPHGTRANVWRRRAGEMAFAPLSDVDGAETVNRVILRAGPGGAALLGLDTSSSVSNGMPPFPTTTTTHRNRVARLVAGDPGFGPAEEAGAPHAVSSNIFTQNSGTQSVDDMLQRPSGAIDVALRRTTNVMFDGTSSRGQLARRATDGTWSTTPELAAGFVPFGSGGGFDAVSPLRLLAPGGDPLLVWAQAVPDSGGQITTELRASWGTFTASQALDTASVASALRLLDADDLDGGRGLALVAEGETVRAVTLGPAGAVPADEALATGAGTVQAGLLAADGAGSALATVTRASASATTAFGTVLNDPVVPQTPGEPGGPGGPGAPVPGGPGGSGGTTPVKPGSGQGAAKDRRAPALSAIGLSRMTFATRGRRKGTKLTWVSSEAGRLLVGVERATRGWRSGSTCVARKPRRGKARRCTSYRSVGTLRVALKEDEGALTFTGKVGGKTLAPGRYRFSLVAVDAAGNRSAARTISFTVTR